MNLLDRLEAACPGFPRDIFEEYLVPDVVSPDDAKVVLLLRVPAHERSKVLTEDTIDGGKWQICRQDA